MERTDPMLHPWLMMPPIRSAGLINLITCLLAAVIVVRLTRSYLIREAMAFAPNGNLSLFTHFFLSTCSSTSFMRDLYLEFSKFLGNLEGGMGSYCTPHIG
jgi:hypothetical protein